MPLLKCNKCHAELSSESSICSHCGNTTPFLCDVCGLPVTSLTTIGWAYPFTKEGKPLCPTHAQRLCDACHKPFPQDQLTKRTASWDFFETTNDYIPVPGSYCSKCNSTHMDPAKPAPRNKTDVLRIAIYSVAAVIVVYLLILLVHTFK